MALSTALSAACVVALLGGCGGPQGSLDEISVTQYRYYVDEAGDVVRVIGVARNTGEKRTPTADVVVTLVGRTGAMKGQNRVELPSLEGGAEHSFALGVTAHGRVEDLRITIVPRGQQLAGEGEATAGDATEGEASAPGNEAATNTEAGEQSDPDAQEGD